MQIESIVTIKKELKHLSKDELLDICLKMGKFKKENKAFLTYLLFQSDDENSYIENVKSTLDEMFESINSNSYFFMKKTIRKILRQIKIYSKYSSEKSTEVELMIYYCEELNKLKPSIHKNTTLSNLYERQVLSLQKKISVLHEDLQFDYTHKLEILEDYIY